MNISPTKINLYKFVSTTGIAAASDAKKEEKANISIQTKQVEAINQLGGVVNGIAASLVKIEKIELARAKALAKKKTFEPEYTTPKKRKFTFAGKLLEAFKAPNFLKGLLMMLGALFKMLIGIPILRWLADKKNQKTIVNTFKIIWGVFKAISTFIGSAFVIGINSLAKALKGGENMSTWQRVLAFAKGIVAFGAIIVGLKWLNPLRIGKTMKEIGMIFKGFNNALFNFRNALRARKGLKALTHGKGVAGTKFLSRGPGILKGAAVVTGVVAAGSMMMGGDAEAGEEGEEEVPERKFGGPIGKQYSTGRSISKYGGMIRGPETGYPVSMDGGKTTSFIGHGTEQVVSDKKGGGYVIPINNAATRANPYLTDYNKVAAAGLGMPNAPEMFLGGLFKGAGNLLKGKTWGGGGSLFGGGSQANYGTGRDGGFGTGTHGSGWPSAWDGKPVGGQTQSPSKKPGLWGQIGNFLSKGDGQTSGAQMIGSMFGNEQAGSAIGNIMGIFQGGGSGEGGKATGWDIIKGIGGVAGSFMKGSKAGGWINSALGIGEILKGDGNWASKFRDIAGQYGNQLAGLIGGKTGATVGNFMNSYFNGTAGKIGDLLSGAMSAQAGTGRIADAANHPGYSGGMGVTDPDGGPKAAKILGRQMLSRGMTVYGHPNFRNNKFKKENKANEKGYDPGGRQPVGGGPFHSKGLGLNIADYRPGDFGARLRNLADFLRGQIDTFKIVQVVYDKWGMWFAGQKEKKGPSKYGYPDSIGVGVAPKTPEDTGVGSQQAVANSQRSIMKKALEGGGGGTGDAALNIRKVLNQAKAKDQGASTSDFGGNFFMDLLGDKNSKISDAFIKPSDEKKAAEAWKFSQDDDYLTNFLYKKGANEDQAMNYMNLIDGDVFSKTPTFNNDDSFSFSDSFKIGNSMFTKDDGKSATDFYQSKENLVSDSASEKKRAQYEQNRANRGAAFTGKKGDTLISSAPKTNSPVSTASGTKGSNAEEKSKDYYNKKASKDRQHATSAMNDKIQATIQSALAAVQAHNSGVQAMVASENQKVLQMQKNAKSMAAKAKRAVKNQRQNQNQSAVA